MSASENIASWPLWYINPVSSDEKPKPFQAVNGIAQNKMTTGQNLLPKYNQHTYTSDSDGDVRVYHMIKHIQNF